MQKTLSIVLLFLTFNILVLGQGTCNLEIAQAPSIRGFRLGMTLNQLYELVPDARTDNNIIGVIERSTNARLPEKTSIQFNSYGSPYGKMPLFKNIGYIGIRLFNDQITDISIQYDWPMWNSADEFIAKLRENLVLPEAKEWQGGELSRQLICKDFEMDVHAPFNSGALVVIRDLTTSKKIQELEKAIIEKARKEFKP